MIDLRALFLRKPRLVCFFSYRSGGEDDGVWVLYQRICKSFLSSALYSVGQAPPTNILLEHHFENRKLVDFNRIVVFSHPFSDYSSFACGRSDFLGPRFFATTSGAFQLVYAHGCSSSKILADDSWSPVMPSCVGYSDEIFLCCVTRQQYSIWTKLLRSFVTSLKNTGSSKQLVNGIRIAYTEGYEEIASKPYLDRGDRLFLVLLDANMSCLEVVER